jgi:CheY-like chemotaxis protein
MAKVLVTDDDVEMVELTKMVLEGGGHEVVTANNADQCRSQMAQEKPDVVLLDVMMERPTDGFELAREFRAGEETKDTPIVMLTAVNQEYPMDFKPDEVWLPVDQFLEKPAKPDQLLEAIEKALRR